MAEKTTMLERAQALDTARKTALEIVKHLTTLEVRPLNPEQEEKAREKLNAARDAHKAAVLDLTRFLKGDVHIEVTATGPLFDQVAKELNDAGILAEARG